MSQTVALIVCPASLVTNWTKEFRKWLGNDRIRVFGVDQKANIKHFTVGKMYHVMIIGYEKVLFNLSIKSLLGSFGLAPRNSQRPNLT